MMCKACRTAQWARITYAKRLASHSMVYAKSAAIPYRRPIANACFHLKISVQFHSFPFLQNNNTAHINWSFKRFSIFKRRQFALERRKGKKIGTLHSRCKKTETVVEAMRKVGCVFLLLFLMHRFKRDMTHAHSIKEKLSAGRSCIRGFIILLHAGLVALSEMLIRCTLSTLSGHAWLAFRPYG